jgi:hypothetical protein
VTKRPTLFKQYDLQRALRAAKAAGLEVKHVELDPVTGRIIITTTAGADNQSVGGTLDNWLTTHARST